MSVGGAGADNVGSCGLQMGWEREVRQLWVGDPAGGDGSQRWAAVVVDCVVSCGIGGCGIMGRCRPSTHAPAAACLRASELGAHATRSRSWSPMSTRRLPPHQRSHWQPEAASLQYPPVTSR